MESGEIRKRFGRCPYCRAMIYPDPEAVIYYCSRCRTPIRGKNPEPTEQTGDALSRLEILSADTASVFTDELDACRAQAPVLDVHGDQDQPPLFSRGDARVCYSNGQDERRASLSRRTRRAACSDSFVLRYGVFMSAQSETEEGFPSPRNACGRQRRRSLVGLEELETSISWSRQQVPPSRVAPSPLADLAFQRDLLGTLDSLRGLIAAIEPASSTGAPRRPLLPPAGVASRAGDACPGARPAPERGLQHRLVAVVAGIGIVRRRAQRAAEAAPLPPGHGRRAVPAFLVCGSCSELLQVPATTLLLLLPRRKVARLRCGGCEEVLELAAAAGVAGSAPHRRTPMSSALPESGRR